MDYEDHPDEKVKIGLNEALYITFRRGLARSPFFVPFILMLFILFTIGLVHSLGIATMNDLFNINST